MIEGLLADLSVSVQTLKKKLGPSCQAAFTGVPVHPSASQQQLSDALVCMTLLFCCVFANIISLINYIVYYIYII
jgi:hypothetical protein